MHERSRPLSYVDVMKRRSLSILSSPIFPCPGGGSSLHVWWRGDHCLPEARINRRLHQGSDSLAVLILSLLRQRSLCNFVRD